MLLLMIERGMPIDMVLVADTGLEFPEMYRHWDRLARHLYRERGLKLTILRHPQGFEWLMFDQPKEKLSALERQEREGVLILSISVDTFNSKICGTYATASRAAKNL